MRRDAARLRNVRERVEAHSLRCRGKAIYEGFSAADKAAAGARRYAEMNVYPYRCRHCQSWHLAGRKPGDRE